MQTISKYGLLIGFLLVQMPLFAQTAKKVAKAATPEMFAAASDACKDKKEGEPCSYEVDGQTYTYKCIAQIHPTTREKEVICRAD
jgi:hypothetical protein